MIYDYRIPIAIFMCIDYINHMNKRCSGLVLFYIFIEKRYIITFITSDLIKYNIKVSDDK